MNKNIKKMLAAGVASTIVFTGISVDQAPAAQAQPQVQVMAQPPFGGFKIEPWMWGVAGAGILAVIGLIAGILGGGGSSHKPPATTTTPSPSTSTTTPKPTTLSEAEKQQLRNELTSAMYTWRKQNLSSNASSITQSAVVNKSAQDWANTMAQTGKFEHSGTEIYVENLYYKSVKPTAQEVITAWANSPGHRRAMSGTYLTRVGFGIERGVNGRYYVVFQGTSLPA